MTGLGELVLPARLRTGDCVAIATPSGPAAHPQRLARGVAALERRGLKVCVGPMAGVTAFGDRTPRARADELNAFLRDGSVRAIFTSIGGHNSNTLIDLVDWDALRADPRPVIGYSDITALLLAALTRAGVVAFHGPTVLPEIAEHPDVLEDTVGPLLQAVSNDRPLGAIRPVERWTEELLLWGCEDVRPRTMRPARPWTWCGSGVARGPLVGGNVETMSKLVGTGDLPSFDGAVVLLETSGTSLEALDSHVAHLRSATDIEAAAGFVVGHSMRGGDRFEDAWQDYVIGALGSPRAPMLLGVHAGHTDPMLTLPLGVQVLLDPGRQLWEVLDAAVH